MVPRLVSKTRNIRKGGETWTFRDSFREYENFYENRRGTTREIFIGIKDIVKITSFVVESGVNNVGDKVYEKQRQRHLSPTGYEIGICRSEFRPPSKEIKHRYDSKMNEILMRHQGPRSFWLTLAGSKLSLSLVPRWKLIVSNIGFSFLYVSCFYQIRCNLR